MASMSLSCTLVRNQHKLLRCGTYSFKQLKHLRGLPHSGALLLVASARHLEQQPPSMPGSRYLALLLQAPARMTFRLVVWACEIIWRPWSLDLMPWCTRGCNDILMPCPRLMLCTPHLQQVGEELILWALQQGQGGRRPPLSPQGCTGFPKSAGSRRRVGHLHKLTRSVELDVDMRLTSKHCPKSTHSDLMV